MSTETEIVRELAPFINKYLLSYYVSKNLETSKLQKVLKDEVCNTPKEALSGMYSRLKSKTDTPLKIEGVSSKFMENLVREVGERFMMSIYLLDDSGSKTKDLSRAWNKRDRLLREIIHEEVQHDREQKANHRRATDAIMITQQFDKVLSKLDELYTSVDGLYEDEDEDESEEESGSEEEEEEDEEEEEESPRGRSGARLRSPSPQKPGTWLEESHKKKSSGQKNSETSKASRESEAKMSEAKTSRTNKTSRK